jgi:nitrate/nitrite transporter NarK
LQSAVDSEESAKCSTGSHRVRDLLSDRGVLHLCLIYFLIQISVYGVVFALPSQVERLLGKSAGLQVGLVTAIPWICALIAAYAVPRVVRGSRRKKGAVLVLLVAALGLAIAGQPQAIVALSALCVAAAGFISVQPVFWTFPTERLSGAAAAGGIALINSVGNLGGFFAPSLREWAEQTFASGSAGMWVLATSTCLAAIAMSALKNSPPIMSLEK